MYEKLVVKRRGEHMESFCQKMGLSSVQTYGSKQLECQVGMCLHASGACNAIVSQLAQHRVQNHAGGWCYEQNGLLATSLERPRIYKHSGHAIFRWLVLRAERPPGCDARGTWLRNLRRLWPCRASWLAQAGGHPAAAGAAAHVAGAWRDGGGAGAAPHGVCEGASWRRQR